MYRLRLIPILMLGGLLLLPGTAEDSADSSDPSATEEIENTENNNDNAGSAMPSRTTNRRSSLTATIQDQPMEELEEVRIREPLGPDPRPLLDDPLILKTEEERKRELIRRHMDLAAQLLNRWTIPLITESLGEQAEEREREAQLEAFRLRQERELRALREVDETYYQERKKEYYDTLLQARERFPPPPRQ